MSNTENSIKRVFPNVRPQQDLHRKDWGKERTTLRALLLCKGKASELHPSSSFPVSVRNPKPNKPKSSCWSKTLSQSKLLSQKNSWELHLWAGISISRCCSLQPLLESVRKAAAIPFNKGSELEMRQFLIYILRVERRQSTGTEASPDCKLRVNMKPDYGCQNPTGSLKVFYGSACPGTVHSRHD